jgi:hypothetical protein
MVDLMAMVFAFSFVVEAVLACRIEDAKNNRFGRAREVMSLIWTWHG